MTKYVVIKRSDAEHMRVTVPGGTLMDCILFSDVALNDAVVIRTQDMFAEAGLRQYGNAILAHLGATEPSMTRLREILRQKPRHMQRELFEEYDLLLEQRENLHAIANYFEECADEAEDKRQRGTAKIPD